VVTSKAPRRYSFVSTSLETPTTSVFHLANNTTRRETDPRTIVSLAGDVTNIVEVIFKTAKTLRELKGKWKDADLTITNLIAQLESLKRVLNKLGKWIGLDLAGVPQHHQLVLDLVILHSINLL